MSVSAETALQQAIYTALTGNASLMAAITGVHDSVGEATGFPYVTIGDGTAIPWDTKTSDGQEHTVTIHTWTQYRGRKQTKEIMDLVYSVLHNSALTVVGHQTVLCQFDFSETLKDPDGVTHHGVQRFRVLTEDT